MAYDEKLAARVRAALAARDDVSERRMFGGVAFLVNGHMTCGVLEDSLVLRLGRDGAARALERRHVRPMDFTGRALGTMVYVSAAGLWRDAELRSWLEQALAFVGSLPAKGARLTRGARSRAAASGRR
jgi:TfoX/Sxy family transcriptional regulator of competence genes